MKVLGIETSCDETAAAVWGEGRILSNVVASQVALHERYGGVVPELASRAHEEKIVEVIEEALNLAGLVPSDLGGVAVTNRPGLVGALLVGLAAAKAVALAQDLPLVGVNHLDAHAYSVNLSHPELTSPHVVLLASGGHTCLVLSRAPLDTRLIETTTDDAAGEAFDKVAKLLGLPYPGGPSVEKAAASGNPRAVAFPDARVKGRPLAFSFSGLKTAVLYHLRDRGYDPKAGRLPPAEEIADIAASFQAAVIRTLCRQTLKAAEENSVRTASLAGGVAQNRALQREFSSACDKIGLEALWPDPSLCGDNGAMIAAYGALLLERGENHGLDLDVQARVVRRK